MGSVLDLGRNSHKQRLNIFAPTWAHLKNGLCYRCQTDHVHVETGSDYHSAEVPEAVLPPHYEERLIKVGMVLP